MTEEYDLDSSAQPRVVFTKDDYGFQKVLDDLPKARLVFISTMHLFNNEGSRDLLDHIRRLPRETRVILVCQLPWDTTMQRALRLRYLSALRPLRFSANIEVYFLDRNHAKIVATDSVAYIGSANFTGATKDNYECGILLENTDETRELLKPIIERMLKDAVRHYGGEVSEALLQLRVLHRWTNYTLRLLEPYVEYATATHDKDAKLANAAGTLPGDFARSIVGLAEAVFNALVLPHRGASGTVEIDYPEWHRNAVEPIDADHATQLHNAANHLEPLDVLAKIGTPDDVNGLDGTYSHKDAADDASELIRTLHTICEQLVPQLTQLIERLMKTPEYRAEVAAGSQ